MNDQFANTIRMQAKRETAKFPMNVMIGISEVCPQRCPFLSLAAV